MAFTLFSDLLGWAKGGTTYTERPASDMPQNTTVAATTSANGTIMPEKKPDIQEAQHKGHETPSSELASVNKGIGKYLEDYITRKDIEYAGYIDIAKARRGGNFDGEKDYRDRGGYADYRIFEDLKDVRKSLLKQRIQELYSVNQWVDSAGRAVPPDERWVSANERAIYDKLDKQVAAEVAKRHYDRNKTISSDALDTELKVAFDAVEREVPSGGGLLNTMTKPFYNDRKGGIQLGGIGGAVLGFMMASTLIPEMGWMGNLAKVLFVFLGAYAGNMFADKISSDNKFSAAATPANAKEKTEPSKGHEHQKGKDATTQNPVESVVVNGVNMNQISGGTSVKGEPTPQLFTAAGNNTNGIVSRDLQSGR